MLTCPYGKIKLVLDFGFDIKKEIILDRPSKALIIGESVWRDMIWLQDDSVLCVLASEHYDPDEYIRDYSEFERYVQENNKHCEVTMP